LPKQPDLLALPHCDLVGYASGLEIPELRSLRLLDERVLVLGDSERGFGCTGILRESLAQDDPPVLRYEPRRRWKGKWRGGDVGMELGALSDILLVLVIRRCLGSPEKLHSYSWRGRVVFSSRSVRKLKRAWRRFHQLYVPLPVPEWSDGSEERWTLYGNADTVAELKRTGGKDHVLWVMTRTDEAWARVYGVFESWGWADVQQNTKRGWQRVRRLENF
jgi:hypothetical protein